MTESLIERLADISIRVFAIGTIYGIKKLEDLSAELNSLSAEIDKRDWQTGKPTEEGWYLVKYECILECKHKGKLTYRAVHIYYDKYGIYNEDGSLGHDDVWKPIEWQKIKE